MKFTRDGAVWLILFVGGVLGFLSGHFDLISTAFPSLGPTGQARIELLSALAGFVGAYLRMSPASLSPDNQLASRESGQTLGPAGGLPKTLSIILLAGALAVAGSACSLSAKQRGVAALGATESALEISHDAERRLCAPMADQTKGIGHCDGAEAKAIGLTDAVHQKAAMLYSRAFEVQAKAAAAAKKWRAGDPVPSDVLSYRNALTDILGVLGGIVPKEQTVIVKLQEAVADAANLAKLAGVK